MPHYTKIITHVCSLLSSGKTILYPTDTVWGIGCDATNEQAISKVYQIKERKLSKSLIVLVKDIKMLQNYITNVPPAAIHMIKSAQNPLTIVYPYAKNLPLNLINQDSSIAIRIVSSGFCYRLLDAFNKPIVSTSANISGAPTPLSYEKISSKIIARVNYTCPSILDKGNKKASTIVQIKNEEVFIIRR